jgi:ABC-type multidrug transport system fused ATPase/permease subunit
VIPALIGYSFAEAPAVTSLTAVTAVLAGAAPVGITIAIGELVDALTSAIGHGLGTPAARECYRWVALIVVLFFLTHLAESARTALGRALGRRVTGRLGERVMMAASEPATIGHLEDPAYLGRLGRARGEGTIDMPPGEAVFGFSTKASMWVTSIGSAALLTRVTWGLGLIVFAVFVVIHFRLVRNFRIAVVENVNQTEKLRRTSYLRDVPTTPGAAREVRLFGLAAFFRDAYQAPADWRARITAAFQDPVPIELSLQDTIGLGSLEHRDDQERVLEALRTAGGGKLLASLPEGLQTRLGRKSWDGKGLSGGQWQTVANARAAMRQAPLLRILDEPSASLDARAEEWLFQQYAGLSRHDGGVTILVTHRFTTARAADLIVVLDGGRVTEVGTHDTLSQADGLYAELFRLQARYFV